MIAGLILVSGYEAKTDASARGSSDDMTFIETPFVSLLFFFLDL